MTEEHDPRISKIFYYFSEHTNIESGRTVGRKIGVVQEVICKKLLLRSERIRDALIYEPKIRGRSNATHKVEFVALTPVEALVVLDNQAVRSRRIDGLELAVRNIDIGRSRASVSVRYRGNAVVRQTLASQTDFEVEIPGMASCVVKLVSVSATGARIAVLDGSKPVTTVESKRVGAQRFSNTDKLGSGIQTIEKAKQISLVAVDLDLAYNAAILAQSGHETPRAFRSIAILGNGVHWTEHDLAILGTYVDYTYLCRDEAIIRYAEFVREAATRADKEFFSFFMAYFAGMTKQPEDAFAVSEADFVRLTPNDGPELLAAIERQIPAYEVTRA